MRNESHRDDVALRETLTLADIRPKLRLRIKAAPRHNDIVVTLIRFIHQIIRIDDHFLNNYDCTEELGN